MNSRTIRLAQQLLGSVPRSEMDDLVKLLQYYNRFAENDRVKAMTNGSVHPSDKFLESEVIIELTEVRKAAGHQLSYATTNQSVCRCCGR